MSTATDSLRVAWEACPPSWPGVALIIWSDVGHAALYGLGGLITGWLALPQPEWRRRRQAEKTPPPAELGDP